LWDIRLSLSPIWYMSVLPCQVYVCGLSLLLWILREGSILTCMMSQEKFHQQQHVRTSSSCSGSNTCESTSTCFSCTSYILWMLLVSLCKHAIWLLTAWCCQACRTYICLVSRDISSQLSRIHCTFSFTCTQPTL
jgi:hypothetical protein